MQEDIEVFIERGRLIEIKSKLKTKHFQKVWDQYIVAKLDLIEKRIEKTI